MKRFAIPLAAILLLLFFIAIIPDGRRITALYDQPTVQESAHAAFTPFEASVRSTRTYVVPTDVDARQTDLANEGKVVTEHDARRWKRAQTWGRSF